MSNNMVFLIGFGALSILLWKLGRPLLGAGLGVLTICCVAPHMASRGVATIAGMAGLPSMSSAIGEAMTLLIPVLGILFMLGWRPRKR